MHVYFDSGTASWPLSVAAMPECCFTCAVCCVLCLVQVGAGHSYQLLPHVFTWQGLSGKFEGFGTSITPLNDDDTLMSA